VLFTGTEVILDLSSAPVQGKCLLIHVRYSVLRMAVNKGRTVLLVSQSFLNWRNNFGPAGERRMRSVSAGKPFGICE
jgi:hypothetical protein